MPPSRSKDLHGAAPDTCPVALLLVDWINDLEFDSGDRLLPYFCVLFTAQDAYMRDFRLVVPRECLASEEGRDNRHALEHMAKTCGADIGSSSAIDFAQLRKAA